jgi:hypothetical protein
VRYPVARSTHTLLRQRCAPFQKLQIYEHQRSKSVHYWNISAGVRRTAASRAAKSASSADEAPSTCAGVWRARRARLADRAPGRDCAFGASARSELSGRGRRARLDPRSALSGSALPYVGIAPAFEAAAGRRYRAGVRPPRRGRGRRRRARAAPAKPRAPARESGGRGVTTRPLAPRLRFRGAALNGITGARGSIPAGFSGWARCLYSRKQ